MKEHRQYSCGATITLPPPLPPSPHSFAKKKRLISITRSLNSSCEFQTRVWWKMRNHQSWFSSMEQFRNVLFKQNCVLFSSFLWNFIILYSISSTSTQWLFGSTYFAQCPSVVIEGACFPQSSCCVIVEWVSQGKLALPLLPISCLQSTVLCPSTKHNNLTCLRYFHIIQ